MTSQSWGEFAHLIMDRFKAGEYPWTRQDFYFASEYQYCAAHTVDPILIDYYGVGDHTDYRVADSASAWWEDGWLWSVNPLPLDDDYKLTENVFRVRIIPIGKPGRDKDNHCTLMEYEVQNGGMSIFEENMREITQLCDRFPQEHVEFITLWECEAGKEADTWVGPGEYYSWWELIGAVIPQRDRVELRKLDESDSGQETPGSSNSINGIRS